MPGPVPATYDQLYRLYYPLMVSLVGRAGVAEHDIGDVTAEVLLRCIETGLLARFDPGATFTHRGQLWPASFPAFLAGFTRASALGLRDRRARLARRELPVLDIPVTRDGLCRDPAELLCQAETLGRLRAHLAGVPRGTRRDRCDLVALFDAAVAQVWATDRLSTAGLAATFGVSTSGMTLWLARLRRHLAEALAA